MTASPYDAVEYGDVLIDSGHILIVDPCHLPSALLAQLTQPNEHGVPLGIVARTPSGGGAYTVSGHIGELVIVDPNVDFDFDFDQGAGTLSWGAWRRADPAEFVAAFARAEEHTR